MRGMNRIFLLGRLGSEPKENHSQTGKSYVQLNLATNRTQLGDDGAKEHTDWHNIFVWGKQGENCQKFLKKGDPVLMEGYLSTYKKQKEDGSREQRTAIHAIRVEFLPKS